MTKHLNWAQVFNQHYSQPRKKYALMDKIKDCTLQLALTSGLFHDLDKTCFSNFTEVKFLPASLKSMGRQHRKTPKQN